LQANNLDHKKGDNRGGDGKKRLPENAQQTQYLTAR